MPEQKCEGWEGTKWNKVVGLEVTARALIWEPKRTKRVPGPVSSSAPLEGFSIRNGKVMKISFSRSMR